MRHAQSSAACPVSVDRTLAHHRKKVFIHDVCAPGIAAMPQRPESFTKLREIDWNIPVSTGQTKRTIDSVNANHQAPNHSDTLSQQSAANPLPGREQTRFITTDAHEPARHRAGSRRRRPTLPYSNPEPARLPCEAPLPTGGHNPRQLPPSFLPHAADHWQ